MRTGATLSDRDDDVDSDDKDNSCSHLEITRTRSHLKSLVSCAHAPGHVVRAPAAGASTARLAAAKHTKIYTYTSNIIDRGVAVVRTH